MDHDEETVPSHIASHLAFGGIVGSIDLNATDWVHLVEKGFVTVNQHRESADGDSIIELTIRAHTAS
jgi:hypothetical protein